MRRRSRAVPGILFFMSNGEPASPAEQTDLQALEHFVVDNDELLQLEERIGRFNIFDALRIVDTEIRHSNFLAWLLDPAESHGQGPLFLKAVLMDLLRQSPPELRPLSPVQIDGAELRGVDIRREWRNIDILIACKEPDFVIAIENKVGSKEHSKQLERYREIIDHEFGETKRQYVYLTRDGDEPSDENWTVYTYEDIHRVLLRVRTANANSIGDDVLAFLNHYIRLIGSRFMDDPQIDELCQTIYKNHRQAIDLIVERVSTVPAYEMIRQLVDETPGWSVLHATRKNLYTTLDSLTWLPPRKDGKKVVHAAWFLFSFIWYPDALRLEVFVGEADDPIRRQSLVNFLMNNQEKYGLKMLKKPGPRYTTLRSYPIGSWKNTEPNEEAYVRKAGELMKTCKDQIEAMNDGLKRLAASW